MPRFARSRPALSIPHDLATFLTEYPDAPQSFRVCYVEVWYRYVRGETTTPGEWGELLREYPQSRVLRENYRLANKALRGAN